ncbi:MAG: DUF4831 family protein [Bacteroidales bacterium]|jgi:hypothetical protein|nr:DUF4831 family protein [Bacteroidales bacterium]
MKINKLILILLALIAFSVSAQKQVIPFTGDFSTATGNGFAYLLPSTSFEVTVTVVKNKDFKGYYGEYAKKILNLNNIITANKVSYQLKNIEIEPVILPDNNNAYWVEYSTPQMKENFPDQIDQYRGQLIAGSNQSCYNIKKSMNSTEAATIPDFYKNYADLAYTVKDDSFVETRIIDGIETQVPVNQTKKVTKSLEQQAIEAADMIISIRKSRVELISGITEVPYTKEAFEYMVNQLNSMEKNYLGLFTGFSMSEEIKYSFLITPAQAGATPLFSFDPEKGYNTIVDEKNGTPYHLVFEPEVNFSQFGKIEKARTKNPKYVPNEGYRVRTAVPTKVGLMQGDKDFYYFGIFSIYQFGKIEILPLNRDHLDIGKLGFIY